MSEVPEDIMKAAEDVYDGLNANCYSADCDDSEKASDVEAIAQAILAERTRCIEAFRCFDYDYAVNFIKSGSVIVDRK
jgi:hypothetical protein